MTKTHGLPTRIGIDCRLSGNAHAGIGRYIENLILRLPANTQFQWVLFFFSREQVPKATAFQSMVLSGHIQIVITPIKHYSLAEQLRLPSQFLSQNLDILHVPHFNVPIGLNPKLPVIITIHDLLWHEQKGSSVTTLKPWKYWLKYLGYRFVTRFAVNRAKTILVPSQTVKKTVCYHYPVVSNKLVVTYEGVDESLYSSFKIKIPPTKSKTLLYVGSLYPHKNLKVVLQALQKLPSVMLEIVGSRSVFKESLAQQAQKLKVANQVRFLGFVPDDELRIKYQSSLALIQPSLSEGFGLTGLEAMAAGGLVIASDIPVFREIYKNHAFYFDPRNSDSLVEIITNMATVDRPTHQAENSSFSKQYSWQKMVDQTLTEYKKLLKPQSALNT